MPPRPFFRFQEDRAVATRSFSPAPQLPLKLIGVNTPEPTPSDPFTSAGINLTGQRVQLVNNHGGEFIALSDEPKSA